MGNNVVETSPKVRQLKRRQACRKVPSLEDEVIGSDRRVKGYHRARRYESPAGTGVRECIPFFAPGGGRVAYFRFQMPNIRLGSRNRRAYLWRTIPANRVGGKLAGVGGIWSRIAPVVHCRKTIRLNERRLSARKEWRARELSVHPPVTGVAAIGWMNSRLWVYD